MALNQFAQGCQAAMQDIAALNGDIAAIQEWVSNNLA